MMRFRMTKINVGQFALLLSEMPTGEIRIHIDMDLKYSLEMKRIMVSMLFTFEIDDHKAMLLQLNCEFEIAAEDWNAAISDGKLTIPKEIIEYFGAQTIGVSRGVLHCKTEGTPFNGIILPPINVSDLVKEDLVISSVDS